MSDTPMMDALKEAVARDAEVMRLREGIERIREQCCKNHEDAVTRLREVDRLCTKLLAGEAING